MWGEIHTHSALSDGNVSPHHMGYPLGVCGKDLRCHDDRLLNSIPLSALPGRNSDIIAITAAGADAIKVLRVEARIAPSQGQ